MAAALAGCSKKRPSHGAYARQPALYDIAIEHVPPRMQWGTTENFLDPVPDRRVRRSAASKCTRDDCADKDLQRLGLFCMKWTFAQ